MVARCETVGKYILPVFRSLVAQELINVYALTQVEAAQKLGTTQAAISQYINSKRATKGIERIGQLKSQLQEMAKETAARLNNGELRPEEISLDFCRICPSFCKKGSTQAIEDFAI